MRPSLSLAVLLLVTSQTELLAASNSHRDAACDVRELRFFNGFGLSLPRGVCVIRTSGPDYWIYQFASDEDGAPFLQAYVGNAANFPYFAPPDGVQITESVIGEKLICGALLIRETPHGDVTQVGGSVTLHGKACGEILVRATSIDGTVSSPAIHFWYSGISKEQEQVVTQIIGSVQRTEQLPDDPPLKSGSCAYFGVKLARPGFGPAAELPASSPARRRHGGCSSPVVATQLLGGNRRAASASARGPAVQLTPRPLARQARVSRINSSRSCLLSQRLPSRKVVHVAWSERLRRA